MGICAKYMKEEGKLKDDTLVVTVLSNLGLKLRMKELGINIEETAVGDRYILERHRQKIKKDKLKVKDAILNRFLSTDFPPYEEDKEQDGPRDYYDFGGFV